MIKYLITLIVFALVFLSCEEKKHYIPIHQLKEVLLQMHLAESYALMAPKDSNVQYIDTVLLAKNYNKIFMQNNISQKDFELSIQYYKNIPGMYDSIYQMILNDISVLQSKIQIEQVKKDSTIVL